MQFDPLVHQQVGVVGGPLVAVAVVAAAAFAAPPADASASVLAFVFVFRGCGESLLLPVRTRDT